MDRKPKGGCQLSLILLWLLSSSQIKGHHCFGCPSHCSHQEICFVECQERTWPFCTQRSLFSSSRHYPNHLCPTHQLDHESASYFNYLARGVLPPITDLSVRMPAQYAWPADLNMVHARLVNPLIIFLNTVPTIQQLSITNHLPFCSFHPHTLPHLSVYSGPHTSILNVATYCNLTRLAAVRFGSGSGPF